MKGLIRTFMSKFLLQRLIASALFDSAIASGGGVVPLPSKISKTTGPMTIKSLPDVKLSYNV